MRLSRKMAKAYRWIERRQPRFWKYGWERLTRRFLSLTTRRLIKTAPGLYCQKRTGSDSAGLLFIKNLLRPERFFLKLLYGQLIPLPKTFRLSENLPPDIRQSRETASWVSSFKSDGFVILPGYFQNEIQGLAGRYSAEPRQDHTPAKELTVRYLSLLDEAFSQIILDETMLSLIGQILGCQPFLQDLPVITVVNTFQPRTSPAEEEIVTEWHSDNVNTVKMLVFLNDVTPDSVRMLIAKGSHRACRVPLSLSDALYSDNYVRSKYQVVNCTGPKGTAVIFDANALHRQYREPQSFRAMLAAKYSPGNGFNFSRKHKEGYFELTRAAKIFEEMPMSLLQRQALKGLAGPPDAAAAG